MAKFVLKSKIFMLHEVVRDANGKLVLGKQLANGAAGGGSVENAIKNTHFAADMEAAQARKVAAHQAKSQALKPVQGEINKIAGTARKQGFNAGRNSATLNTQVLKNTWNKMGTGGKVGTAAAGVVAAGLMAKGIGSIFNKKKEKKEEQKSYSIKRIK